MQLPLNGKVFNFAAEYANQSLEAFNVVQIHGTRADKVVRRLSSVLIFLDGCQLALL